MKRGWKAGHDAGWSSEGYWASYSDLMAGVLLVFAVAAAAAWIEFRTGMVKPTETLRNWQNANQRLCNDPELEAGQAIEVDCSTGRLLISERSLRYETAATELPTEGRDVLARVVPLYLQRYLASVCEGRTDCEALKGIEVSGHTDETGSYQLNGRLGGERAQRVLDYMMSSASFSAFHSLLREKAFTTGYADTRAPDGGPRTVGRRDDARRIEIQVHFDGEKLLRDVNKILQELDRGGPPS